MKNRAVLLGVCVVWLAGCTRDSRSPDAIRQDTANATATVAKDTKAVVQGVAEGLKRKGPVNINKADREELQSLPGVTPQVADTIIADRPYQSSSELLRRRIVTKAEYDQIADKVIAQ